MFTTRVISTAAFLVFVTVVYVGAIPIKIHGETLGLNGGVYTEPELAEALARSYAALEGAERDQDPLRTFQMNARNLDHIGGGNLLRSLFKRNDHPNRDSVIDSIGGGSLLGPGAGDNAHVSHFPRQSRHGLDSLSGATFGESKRFTLSSKSEWPNNINGLENYGGPAKRNIDEIDRTGFDNFLKRNFDEIDRSGWDSFVKRRMINSYLATKQH